MFLKFIRNGSGNCSLSKASAVSNAFVNSLLYCQGPNADRQQPHSNAICNKPGSPISHHMGNTTLLQGITGQSHQHFFIPQSKSRVKSTRLV
jgi:hypothetical protein